MSRPPAPRPVWSAPGRRRPEEIAQILAYRADRAIREFTAAVHAGPSFLCPICGYRGMFSAKGHKPSVWCPQCDSRPRHRLLALWMAREMRLPPSADVLHFSAEPWVRSEMTRRGAGYRTADLDDPGVDLHLDITRIDLGDATLDMVLANHVLEHVDDSAALREIARVLRPGGQAVITVPLVEGWDATYSAGGLDPAERALRCGDPDHLRFYGRDFRDRLRAAGFAVREFAATEPDVSTHALRRGERIFIAQRPNGPENKELGNG